MSNAHNYISSNLPVYRFLCELQSQNQKSSLHFDWGSLMSQFSFLPRVNLGGVILFQATWQLKKSDFIELLESDENEIVSKILKWKAKWMLPDYFYIADGDNELLIYLSESDLLLMKLFLDELRKRSMIVLKEFLFDYNNSVIKSKRGTSYTNEFICSIIRKSSHNLKQNFEVPLYSFSTQRKFALGSEWIYFKIYCGVKTSDEILVDIISPFSEMLLKENLIEKWFFIRFSDPNPHIRVRFNLRSLNQIDVVISRFHDLIKDYIENGLIGKLQTDTYNREIERYGEHSITFAEKLFFYDSIYSVNMLQNISIEKSEELRWLFALKSLDELLNDFRYSSDDKINFLIKQRDNFKKEFNINKTSQIQMDNKFRAKRKEVIEVLQISIESTKKYFSLLNVLATRSKNNKKVSSQIIANCNLGVDNKSLDDLLSSYAHMHMNRIFRSRQRMSEMLIYDFLSRFHISQRAKKKNTSQFQKNESS